MPPGFPAPHYPMRPGQRRCLLFFRQDQYSTPAPQKLLANAGSSRFPRRAGPMSGKGAASAAPLPPYSPPW